jgi:hypothetical protein
MRIVLMGVALLTALSLQAAEIAKGVIGGSGIDVAVESKSDLQIGDNRFLIHLSQGGQPFEGATVEARTFKPHHGPQMPSRDFRAEAEEIEPGVYAAALPLDHKCGTWRFGLSVEKKGQKLGAFRAPMPFR